MSGRLYFAYGVSNYYDILSMLLLTVARGLHASNSDNKGSLVIGIACPCCLHASNSVCVCVGGASGARGTTPFPSLTSGLTVV